MLGQLRCRSRASGAARSSDPGRPSRSRARGLSRSSPVAGCATGRGPRTIARPVDDRAVGQQPEQREHRHRLAAAALTGDAEDLALLDREVDAVDDRDGSARSRRGERAGPRPRARLTAEFPRAPGAARIEDVAEAVAQEVEREHDREDREAGNVPIHQHWKYCVPRRPSSPTRPSAAARRARGTRDRTAAGSRCRDRASRARAPGRRRSAGRRGLSARRADAPSRRADWTYSESPTDMHEPAHDAGVRRPRDDDDRERRVAKPAARAPRSRPSPG